MPSTLTDIINRHKGLSVTNIIRGGLKVKIKQELKEGKCTVIAENVAGNKEFEGYYNSELNLVFFAIPITYKILGYLQD